MNETDAPMTAVPRTPIKQRVDNIFIPVKDVNRSREWYRDVLGLPVGEVLFGHLCVIELAQGPGLLLDQKLTPDGPADEIEHGRYPLFMFATDDVEAALAHLRRLEVELVPYDGQVIQNGHWFNFRDCDGNLLMVCA